MGFSEKGHFVRIFGLSSKIRQLKKSTDGLFQQLVRGHWLLLQSIFKRLCYGLHHRDASEVFIVSRNRYPR